jgi:hypothetical protein
VCVLHPCSFVLYGFTTFAASREIGPSGRVPMWIPLWPLEVIVFGEPAAIFMPPRATLTAPASIETDPSGRSLCVFGIFVTPGPEETKPFIPENIILDFGLGDFIAPLLPIAFIIGFPVILCVRGVHSGKRQRLPLYL